MSRIKQADQAGRPGRQISEQQLPRPSRAIPVTSLARPGPVQLYCHRTPGLRTRDRARCPTEPPRATRTRTAHCKIQCKTSARRRCQRVRRSSIRLQWQIRASGLSIKLWGAGWRRVPDRDPGARAGRGRDGGPGGETSQRPTGPGRGHQTWKPETKANLSPLCSGIITRTSAVRDSGPGIQAGKASHDVDDVNDCTVTCLS